MSMVAKFLVGQEDNPENWLKTVKPYYVVLYKIACQNRGETVGKSFNSIDGPRNDLTLL